MPATQPFVIPLFLHTVRTHPTMNPLVLVKQEGRATARRLMCLGLPACQVRAMIASGQAGPVSARCLPAMQRPRKAPYPELRPDADFRHACLSSSQPTQQSETWLIPASRPEAAGSSIATLFGAGLAVPGSFLSYCLSSAVMVAESSRLSVHWLLMLVNNYFAAFRWLLLPVAFTELLSSSCSYLFGFHDAGRGCPQLLTFAGDCR